jgi:hypothetical protein
MKNTLFGVILGLLVFSPFLVSAGSEVSINKEGLATITATKVMQVAGNTLFMRMYWGDAFVRFTVKTGSNTKFTRATGESTTIKEVKEGDILDVSGELESGSNTLTLVAKSVRNSSVEKLQSSLSGKVVSVDLQNSKFSLDTKTNGVVSVLVATTTVFNKGTRTIDLARVKSGDTVTRVTGDYDIPTKVISARTVLVYIDPNTFKPKNFEGKIIEIGGTTLPTYIKAKVGEIEYTVQLNEKTSVMRQNKASVSLTRFEEGDTVRFYGQIQEVDLPIIDASIIRNMSL